MKLITALILLCAATAASANPFPSGNALAGQKLFEKHNCNHCHNEIMRGDGNKIFTRVTRIVNSPSGMIEQIGRCSGNVNAHLTPQETQDIAAYLNRYYKLK